MPTATLGRNRLRDRPNEPYQLTSNGYRGDLRQFAPIHEPAEPSMQTLLGSLADGQDRRRKARLALLERAPHARRMAIVPGCLD